MDADEEEDREKSDSGDANEYAPDQYVDAAENYLR
jgi:hypothetical protein